MSSSRVHASSLLVLLAMLLATCSVSCVLVTSKWGLDAIDTMVTPVDPPMSCGTKIPSDPHALQRAGCAYGQGAHVAQTLGIPKSVSDTIPIRHVIIMMKENRSFDHILGHLHEQGQPGVEAIPPDYFNPDLDGHNIAPFHATTTCIGVDPSHQSADMKNGVAGGAMTGFVKNAATSTGTDGHFAISNYENTDLPFYYWLANTYTVNDHHFASMQTGTYGVRNFLMFGTNAGVVDTGITYPDPSTPSIFTGLMNAGFTWGVYTDGTPFSGTLGWSATDPGVHSMQDLYDALDKGTLPNVVFVDGAENIDDDHPPSNLQTGEAWARTLYHHVTQSPQWPRLALIWTYDEGGAFADHVPPPKGCPALPSTSPFTDFGPRVPFVMVSPWANAHAVSHVVHDHTAITRFIETIFDLPALTARDANSDALLDMFDFSCGRTMTSPPAPASGTGGCSL